MINDRYYVKIVPEKGETVHRFQVRRRHMAAALGALALIILGSIGFAFAEVIRARMEVSHLAAQAAAQQASLRQIDSQTEKLRKQLQHVQKQNTEIRQLIGAPPSGSIRAPEDVMGAWGHAPSGGRSCTRPERRERGAQPRIRYDAAARDARAQRAPLRRSGARPDDRSDPLDRPGRRRADHRLLLLPHLS